MNNYKNKILYYINFIYEKFLYYFLIFFSIVILSIYNENYFRLNYRKYFFIIFKPSYYIVENFFFSLNSFYLKIRNVTQYEILNKNLLEENERLKQMYNNLYISNYENQNLKKILKYIDNFSNKKYITSKIYYNINNQFNVEAIIPVGLKDGIKKNNIVLDEKNILIGKVINVENNFSKLLFINSLSSNIPAKTLKTNERFILTGYKNNLLKISYYLNSSINLEDNEDVFTSNDGNVIMEDILIGKIKKIKDNFYVEINDIEKKNFVKILID